MIIKGKFNSSPVYLRTIALFSCSVLILACSSGPKPQHYYPYKDREPVEYIEPDVINRPLTPEKGTPISQIVLKRNQPFAETWDRALNAVQTRKFPTTVVDRSQGILYTDWIKITDTSCDQHNEPTPLQCRMRFYLEMAEISASSSSFAIRYEEQCDFPGQTAFVCPGSNAEKMLFEIAREVAPDVAEPD